MLYKYISCNERLKLRILTILLCLELFIIPFSTSSVIGIIGSLISMLFMIYGLFKSWGEIEAEGDFGGGLLMAGALNDRVLGRWNWSIDLILVGLGLGSAAVVQSDKRGQIFAIFFILVPFCLAYIQFYINARFSMSTEPISLEELDSEGKIRRVTSRIIVRSGKKTNLNNLKSQ